ncbi:SufD family Fe-S cluster assembly protein [Candidatus Tachikawaea gelatinosa]|uniref:FeS assembly protein SufD n=1 Tax=Candidatus Tachikawaea gelatinosa TaxID=1410383 RepID=A0A090ALY5_9ENTR|nr:SufD family Fe-S cluster assembly protein [Candidatus Tachikawaea gelatinosa]BAP58669.1 FeS assembly protein SufD [Candidatus Tachikawaea gelatinosa]
MNGLSDRDNKFLQKWYNYLQPHEIKKLNEYQLKHLNLIKEINFFDVKKKTTQERFINLLLTNSLVSTQFKNLKFDHLLIPIDSIKIIFVNGFFLKKINDTDADDFQISFIPLSSKTFKKVNNINESTAFFHLTESLLKEYINIKLPSNVFSKYPLYLLYINIGEKNGLNIINYRHNITLENGSSTTIIEHYININNYPCYTNMNLTIKADNNVRLNHKKIVYSNNKSYHIAQNRYFLKKDVIVKNYNFLLKSKNIENKIFVKFEEKNSNFSIKSLGLPFKNSHYTINTDISHNKGYCKSNQLHKIVTKNRGTGSFKGSIKIFKKAKKTNSKMINHNLILTKFSKVTSVPQLEIYANNVKCSHGVTIGTINKEQIFYLCSRGINKALAKYIIIYGFISESLYLLENKNLNVFIKKLIIKCFSGEKYDF